MKKLSSKGFTSHLGMLVILALVLGAMGFAGYRVWQRRNINAQAYRFSILLDGPVVVRACKTNLGSSWQIRAYATSVSNTGASWLVTDGYAFKINGTVQAKSTSSTHLANILKTNTTPIYALAITKSVAVSTASLKDC